MGQLIHRALIVDDEPTIREATSRAMSAHSFCCDTAVDGNQALRMYGEERHDLVVTDLRMPNCHGHSLIMELMKDSEPPKIVVLTGVANNQIKKDLRNRGVEDIVHKPVDFQIFAAKMLSLLDPEGWALPIERGKKIRPGDQRHPLVRQIEESLDLFALCIPPELDYAFFENAAILDEQPANLIQFLEHLSQQRSVSADRRKVLRIPVFSTAIAIPVNKDFVVQGDACKVTFRDLSEGGACLFNTRPFSTEYLALQWRSLFSPKRTLKAVLHVSRCNPLGPFYEIGGPFVMHD